MYPAALAFMLVNANVDTNVASVRKSILHFQLSDKTLTLRSMYPAALAFMLVSANHGRLRVCKCSSQGMFNICDCRSRNV